MFENRICVTDDRASLAARVNVAVLLFVATAPPLMMTDPDGGWLSTTTLIVADVVWLPAPSRACADSTCAPLLAVVVFQTVENGDAVSSAPRLAPSRRNCTPETLTLSDAVALTVTDAPPTAALFAGALTETVGGVVSAVAVTDRVNVDVRVTPPPVADTVTVEVPTGVVARVVIVAVVLHVGKHDVGTNAAVAAVSAAMESAAFTRLGDFSHVR